MVTTTKAIKKFFQLSQPPPELVSNYRDRTNTAIKGLEAVWGGKFVPPKLSGNTDDEKDKASQQLYALVFLDGADKIRFQSLKSKLHNDFLAGTKKAYPKNLDDITALLEGYQAAWAPSTNPRIRQEQSPPNQTSFHQQADQDDDELSDYEEVNDNQSHNSHPNTRVRGRGIFSNFSGWNTPHVLPGQAQIWVTYWNNTISPSSYLLLCDFYHFTKTQRSVLDDTRTAITLLIKS